MKRVLLSLFFAGVLTIIAFSAVLADSYDIPIVVDGKAVTITIEVRGSSLVSTSTQSQGVLIGEPKKLGKLNGTDAGHWAKLNPDALTKVVIDEDKFEGTTTYTSKTMKGNMDTQMYLSLTAKGKDLQLRIMALYVGEKELGLDECIILADGIRYKFELKPRFVLRDITADGQYFEGAIIGISEKNFSDLEEIANASKVSVRFGGTIRNYDHDLSAAEKQTLSEILAVY